MNEGKFLVQASLELALCTRKNYCDIKGWDLPDNESGGAIGYIVTRSDGSQTWIERKVFDRTHKIIREEKTIMTESEIIDYTVKITGDCDVWIAKTYPKNLNVINAISDLRSYCLDKDLISFEDGCTIVVTNNYE